MGFLKLGDVIGDLPPKDFSTIHSLYCSIWCCACVVRLWKTMIISFVHAEHQVVSAPALCLTSSLCINLLNVVRYFGIIRFFNDCNFTVWMQSWLLTAWTLVDQTHNLEGPGAQCDAINLFFSLYIGTVAISFWAQIAVKDSGMGRFFVNVSKYFVHDAGDWILFGVIKTKGTFSMVVNTSIDLLLNPHNHFPHTRQSAYTFEMVQQILPERNATTGTYLTKHKCVYFPAFGFGH